MRRKLLPLPIGGEAPQGSSVRFWQQYTFRARLDRAAMLLGVLLAVGGAWLGAHPAPVAVSIDRAGYHLGGIVLPPVATGRYSGDAAVAVRQDDGQLRASAAGKLRGVPMQGLCIYVVGSDTEQCIFVVGKHSFHAEDRAVGPRWHRRYDDGRTVDIRLGDAAHPTPVPLPVGWE
ncbi:MAG: hypothetical protein M3010_03735 [Candidatus Dormibacteraeota bacterium]|nr:hypothetical protein [Candidatus Dormibacteraeota bacterium]